MLLAWFLVCCILLENRDEQCEEKKTNKKARKEQNKANYTTVQEIAENLTLPPGLQIKYRDNINDTIFIELSNSSRPFLKKISQFKNNDIKGFVSFIIDFLFRTDKEEQKLIEEIKKAHIKADIIMIEHSIATEGHTIQEIEMERELLFAFREKHQINEFIDPLGKAIRLTELKKDTTQYKICYKQATNGEKEGTARTKGKDHLCKHKGAK